MFHDNIECFTGGTMQEGAANPNWKGGISTNYYRYKLIQKERYPDRLKARERAYDAVKAGKLIKQNCEVCGSQNVQLHHDSYDHPLKVRWLCPAHHREFHNGMGVGRAQEIEQ